MWNGICKDFWKLSLFCIPFLLYGLAFAFGIHFEACLDEGCPDQVGRGWSLQTIFQITAACVGYCTALCCICALYVFLAGGTLLLHDALLSASQVCPDRMLSPHTPYLPTIICHVLISVAVVGAGSMSVIGLTAQHACLFHKCHSWAGASRCQALALSGLLLTCFFCVLLAVTLIRPFGLNYPTFLKGIKSAQIQRRQVSPMQAQGNV